VLILPASNVVLLDLRLRLLISELIHFSNVAMIKPSIYQQSLHHLDNPSDVVTSEIQVGYCLNIATQFL